MSLAPGSILSGNLRLVRKLGSGGMGSVWLAEHLFLGTNVAVKVMASEWAKTPSARERFLREARITARVENEHVVRALDCRADAPEGPYLVLELLDGEDLAHIVEEKGPLPLAVVADIVAQTCQALAATHAQGILHRDLKPENIFLVAEPELTVKLLDFGVARPIDHDECLPMDGAAAGTPAYMSPDQIFDFDRIDARSDLFALGAVAYFALTGKTPFAGATLSELYIAIDDGEFLPLRAHRPDLPAAVDRWMDRALAREPAHRFGDADEMARTLRVIVARETESRRTPRRRRTVGVAAAMVFAAAAASLVAWHESADARPDTVADVSEQATP